MKKKEEIQQNADAMAIQAVIVKFNECNNLPVVFAANLNDNDNLVGIGQQSLISTSTHAGYCERSRAVTRAGAWCRKSLIVWTTSHLVQGNSVSACNSIAVRVSVSIGHWHRDHRRGSGQ